MGSIRGENEAGKASGVEIKEEMEAKIRQKDEELRQLRQEIERIDAENLKYRQITSQNEELLCENQRLLEENAQIVRENKLLNKYLNSIKEQNLSNCAPFVANARNSETMYDETIEAVRRKAKTANLGEGRGQKIEIRMFNAEGPNE